VTVMPAEIVNQNYPAFLASKEPRHEVAGVEPGPLSPLLWDFAAAIVRTAVRKGLFAIFADCGLSKTRMQGEWIRHFAGPSLGLGLVVAPLGVTEQTIAEFALLGIEAKRVREAADVTGPGIYVTNYERLERFAAFPWDAIVLDESSILKSVDGSIRTLLIDRFSTVPRRLCCTATPAPNDVTELANHAEFLGAMSRAEMLATFFVHDSDGKGASGGGWRLKGHAEQAMWRWMARWAVFVRRPSDLGFPDDGFNLPPLEVRDEVVDAKIVTPGQLFAVGVGGVGSRAQVRKQTLGPRVARALELIQSTPGQWIVWCGLNPEQDAIARALGAEAVSIDGSTPEDARIDRLRAWLESRARVLVSKVRVFGFGLNFQNCHNMLFLGIGDSYEQFYQGVRRCWRFGQKYPVNVRVVVSFAEGEISENVRRKEREAANMAAQVVVAMREVQLEEIRGIATARQDYTTADDVAKDGRWRLMLGDCVERIREVETGSVGLSVFSPPFAALYTYSASERDMGNCRDYDEFFKHFGYLIPELLRVTKPARRACVHVQQVTTTKTTHGVIGWRDFRADVVRAFVAVGWVYDGEIVIDKDPQAQAIRTKSKALMFVQKNKDSTWSRPAMADYILLFRAPGDNPEPIVPDVSNEEWISWARPIWYGIRESETLQSAAGREEKDEKHIAPLQLETVERCVRLWSNRGDLVLTPFLGIGTEAYQAVKLGRRAVGIELKPSYFRAAVKNVRAAVAQHEIFPASPPDSPDSTQAPEIAAPEVTPDAPDALDFLSEDR
jgi:DNA modification methylase